MTGMRVVCPQCGTTNTVPPERLGDQPKCGKCREPLFSAHPAQLTEDSFTRHLQRNDIPLLVDFWAPWCGPCLAMAPAFEEAAARLEPRVRLAKLNTDEEQLIGASQRIRSIPTMILFHGGREIARRSGAMMAADIVNWVQSELPTEH
ncbi:MAG: thioredoxin TrxC [Lysobacterales bacterium]|jgi:thioredoxin 2